MARDRERSLGAIAGALWALLGPPMARAQGDGTAAEEEAAREPPLACVHGALENAAGDDHARPFEPAYILAVAAIPRVDGWDAFGGHRSGWGMTAGVDLSPWKPATEVHLELTYFTNRDDRLVSVDFGLKVPFHQGQRWDLHGVVGPALAYDRERRTLDDGEAEIEHGFVVGMIAGLGTAYWFHRHLGATLDVNYRVLGGEGIAHRLFTSMGMAARW